MTDEKKIEEKTLKELSVDNWNDLVYVISNSIDDVFRTKDGMQLINCIPRQKIIQMALQEITTAKKEVAKEILDELFQRSVNNHCGGIRNILETELEELRKKYLEDENHISSWKRIEEKQKI